MFSCYYSFPSRKIGGSIDFQNAAQKTKLDINPNRNYRRQADLPRVAAE